jgi:hypothetical protein
MQGEGGPEAECAEPRAQRDEAARAEEFGHSVSDESGDRHGDGEGGESQSSLLFGSQDRGSHVHAAPVARRSFGQHAAVDQESEGEQTPGWSTQGGALGRLPVRHHRPRQECRRGGHPGGQQAELGKHRETGRDCCDGQGGS